VIKNVTNLFFLMKYGWVELIHAGKTSPGCWKNIRYGSIDPEDSRVCIFSSYSHGNRVPEYVFYYLQKIRDAGFEVIFVSSSLLDAEDVERISGYGGMIIETENVGLDFSSWRAGLEEIGHGRKCSAVLLANDSVLGPLYDLGPIMKKMRSAKYDIWGMTENCQIKPHVQSYFLHIGPEVLRSGAWEGFWNSIQLFREKKMLVRRYEIGFSSFFRETGFQIGAYVPYDAVIRKKKIPGIRRFFFLNPSFDYWDVLITDFGFPFIKREIFRKARSGPLGTSKWRAVLEGHTEYPVELISDYLKYLDSSGVSGYLRQETAGFQGI